jgi:hypothetical protein
MPAFLYYFPSFHAKRTQSQPARDEIRTQNHANGTDFTHNFCLHLLKKVEEIEKNARFLQISDINTLNSMYNKDLHKYFTTKYTSREEFTHSSSGGKICKTNPI